MEQVKRESSESSATPDVEALLNQIEALTLEVEQSDENYKLQRALYRIADITNAAENMDSFYSAIHQVINELTCANDFFIALYHEEEECLSFPYDFDYHGDRKQIFQDKYDDGMIPLTDLEGSLTLRVIQENRLVHVPFDPTIGIGKQSQDWIGVPLQEDSKLIGVLCVQSYEPGFRYTERDIELVKFVSRQFTTAMQRRKNQVEIEQAHQKLQHSAHQLEKTNRKLTKEIEERDEIDRQMVELSHRAGKAEVATGVLHNVGNVLNSVNVSLGVIHEAIRDSRLTSFHKVATLINQQENLGDFFSQDERGKSVPVYLKKLTEQLGTENTFVKDEIRVLLTHLKHIKSVVSMQQAYAGVSGLKEPVFVFDLMTDAELLASASLEKHMIEVERNYDELPQIMVERQKTLQILVNLLKNAKDAILGFRYRDRKLTIGIKMRNDNRIVISIKDNGCGISPDNQEKIFNHGFTTKEGGHGFGLHSCAAMARDMGGQLYGTSEGLGKGATFTLELPFEPTQTQ